jgi:GTP-binding protein
MEDKQIKSWSDCDFKIGAVRITDIPPVNFSEIAFAGRSNVGKSSIINAITGRNSLTRTSKKPGCTQQLNFFLLNQKIMLVDMPGYGYAKASKRTIAGWNKTIQDYLGGRAQLKRIFLLVDSRRGLKDSDKSIMKLLDEKAVSYQIVLTKIDKTPKKDLESLIKNLEKQSLNFPAMHPNIVATSSVSKEGVDILRETIQSFV